MYEVLLVGGTADGRRVSIHQEMPYIFMQPPVEPLYRQENNKPVPELVRYNIIRLRGEKQVFKVGLLEGLDGDDLVNMLIKGYKN